MTRPSRATPTEVPPRGLLLLGLAATLLVLFPVAVTVDQALAHGLHVLSQTLRARSSFVLLWHTALVAGVATPLAGILGIGTAWFVERTSLPGRRLWALLLVAPLTVPPFVTSYAWASLGNPFQGYWGAVGIIGFSYYPIVYLLVAVSLRGLDPDLEETARSLGLNARQTFFRVILPQLRPAILGGLLLVALDSLVEFDAFVALRYQTFSIDIYAQYRVGLSAAGAAALSLFSVALCVILLVGESWLRGGANYTRVSMGARRPPWRYRLGRWTVPVLALVLTVVAVGVGIPVGTLVHWFLQSTSSGLSSATANLHYLLPATYTSLWLGVSSAVVALILALPIAVLALRSRSPMATAIERGAYLSYALPDLVGAIALSYAASHYLSFLYGTSLLLIYAEAILFVPFAIVALRATLGQIEPSLEDSARALGSGPLRAFWRVMVPLARPGFLAAGVLVFAFALGDLSTAQVLLPFNSYTLGTEFEANASTVAFAAAAPFAAVLIGLAILAAYVVMSRFGTVRELGES
jgi:iron(III) transport system permease protein